MDIEIILEPDISPDQFAELAVAAESYGIRAIWSSNYHQHWDAFLSLVPAALATRKILLGPLAVSPYESHPLKLANALLTLNEMSQGRARLALGGGGSVLRWIKDDINAKKLRIVRGVREAVEIIRSAASGQQNEAYAGEIFEVVRPYRMSWVKSPPAQVFTCSTEPQMLRMGARVADGLQMSDVAMPMIDKAMDNIQVGLEQRELSADNFRIGNFWAWHIKKDRDVSMYEARRELIWRGSLLPPFSLSPFLEPDEEQLVIEHWMDFMKAFFTRSGQIDGVPESIVNHLIAELSSAGTADDIDAEIERYRQFVAAGVTDLA
ncbi:MAG: LLM class flavin-dependent oxidoreductase, partial [Gammaproteobacteria bacterium]|nr:LLM class flavin-dependent oxidoreductase [Gammaproteobacteria bacterium]